MHLCPSPSRFSYHVYTSVSAFCHCSSTQLLFLKLSLCRRNFLTPERFSDRLVFDKVHIFFILETKFYVFIQTTILYKVFCRKLSVHIITQTYFTLWGYAVAQLVESLRYKLEGRGFDSRWCNWNFSLT